MKIRNIIYSISFLLFAIPLTISAQSTPSISLLDRLSLGIFCHAINFPNILDSSDRCFVTTPAATHQSLTELENKYQQLVTYVSNIPAPTPAVQPVQTIIRYVSVPGPQGEPGPVGPQGPQGPAGPAGATTESAPFTTNYNYQYVPVGGSGGTGPQGATGPQGPAGTPGAPGATGATGPAGPVGPQGATGTPGTNGIDGVDGIDGIDGADGTTTIVHTIDPVTNDLTSENNTMTSVVNGVTSTTDIITSNVASSSDNFFEVLVNGVSSGLAAIISNNILSFNTTTNVLTSNINGIISTTTIPNSGSPFSLQYYAESSLSPDSGSPIASGDFSVAIGDGSEASGDYSSAFGQQNNASGEYSSAFGYNNTASADYSSVFGSSINNNIANSTMIGPSNSAKVTILSSGNVGIGTTTATEKLMVEGNIAPATNLTHTLGTSALRWNEAWVATLNLGTSTWSLTQGNNGRFSIFDQPSAGGNERFTILANGNVGIGTTTPDSLLSVGGDMNLIGALLANGNAGTAGQVLMSTGSGLQWVATSSLGIVGGEGEPLNLKYYMESANTPTSSPQVGATSSVAIGEGSFALGDYSMAIGNNGGYWDQVWDNDLGDWVDVWQQNVNEVLGEYSMAVGRTNSISELGNYSFAFGGNNTIYESESFAFGDYNGLYVYGDFAVGKDNFTDSSSNADSFLVGNDNSTDNTTGTSYAFGGSNNGSGYSFNVGLYNSTSCGIAFGSNNSLSGGYLGEIFDCGEDSLALFAVGKSNDINTQGSQFTAFAAGNGNYIDNSDSVFAFGANNLFYSSNSSFAFGKENGFNGYNSNDGSYAFGELNYAGSDDGDRNSFGPGFLVGRENAGGCGYSFGYTNFAQGEYDTGTDEDGDYHWCIDNRSYSFGGNNHAENGSAAFGIGFEDEDGVVNNRATGWQSLAFGGSNNVTGDQAVAFGRENYIDSLRSYAFGYDNFVEIEDSYAFGYNNTLSGEATGAFILGSNITNQSANSVMIGTSDTAKMTIFGDDVNGGFATGSVSIGTTTSLAMLTVAGDLRIGTADEDGCIQGYDGVTLSVGTCSSDERLKTDIRDIENVVGKIANIQVVNYKWNGNIDLIQKKGYSTTNDALGVLAQNVEEYFPELVNIDNDGYKRVNYSGLQIYTLAAVSELAKSLGEFSGLFTTSSSLNGNVNQEFNFNERTLTNVMAIQSSNGSWSIDESGRIKAKYVQADGIEMRDKDGKIYCYKSEYGELVRVGEGLCDAYTVIGNDGGNSSGGTSGGNGAGDAGSNEGDQDGNDSDVGEEGENSDNVDAGEGDTGGDATGSSPDVDTGNSGSQGSAATDGSAGSDAGEHGSGDVGADA